MVENQPKTSTSFRLSREALVLIRKLAEDNAISQAAVIEISVRRFSEQHRSVSQ